jgi:hypothetical protein
MWQLEQQTSADDIGAPHVNYTAPCLGGDVRAVYARLCWIEFFCCIALASPVIRLSEVESESHRLWIVCEIVQVVICKLYALVMRTFFLSELTASLRLLSYWDLLVWLVEEEIPSCMEQNPLETDRHSASQCIYLFFWSIIVFTGACHWTLSWARWIQSTL